jgi:hypothetical protein
MSAVQNLNTDLLITNKVNPTADITIATRTVFIDGNLQVGGNTTTVTRTELEVSDNTVTVNKGGGGASGVVLGYAGLEVDRKNSSGTGLANVSIRWNEAVDKWQITNDGTLFGNITTSSGVGAISIIDDPAPQLGGNLDTLARSIYSSNVAVVKFDDNVAIQTTAVAPSAVANYNVIYSQTPNGGGSGLYVTNTTNANRELASSRKAIVYSLVL